MTFPVEIGIGAFKISAHLLLETLGFVLGFQYYQYLRRNTQDLIPQENRTWILIGGIFGAFFLSRLAGALEYPQAWAESPYPWLYLFQSKTITGGLFGGLLGVELAKKYIGERNSSGDLFTFPIILGMMIGRLGCFSNGVYEATYGIPTTLPWGMDLGDGLLRHPVALYEIGFLGILWIVLKAIGRRWDLVPGYIFQFFMIAYFAFRFILEFIKPSIVHPFQLTTIQVMSIIVLLYYLPTLIRLFSSPQTLLRYEQS